jgi:hypothetical protein
MDFEVSSRLVRRNGRIVLSVEPCRLLCKSASVDIMVVCVEKRGRRFNYLRSPVSTLVTAHSLYVRLSLYILTEWHVPPSPPPLPQSTAPMATFVPCQASDLARVIREYEAGGLRDAAAMSDLAVPPM